MIPPIKGMQLKPYGEDYMVGAWLGCLIYTYDIKAQRDLFEKETGIDIYDIVSARGIMQMIDRATGRTSEAIAKWADWVTENIWGVEK